MARVVFTRHYNGKEFIANSLDDTFNTKRLAIKRANAWRFRGYNARVARGNYGTRKYAVYHSVEYARR